MSSTKQKEIREEQLSFDELPAANSELTDIPIDEELRSNWPATLQSINELILSELKRMGFEEQMLADKLTMALGQYFGGRDIYIPKGDNLRQAIRNIEIWRKFTGFNDKQLAHEYGLTERQLRNILSQQRTAEFKRKQTKLF